MCVCVMDSLSEGGPDLGDRASNLLLLGAIAAASAFVVTIVIVLVCVGCQRKKKSKHPPANGEKGTSVNMRSLRQPKLNSMSKSDTRLHEINRLPCNGAPKNRPASMDLLLLHSRRSQSDLRLAPARQLPQISTSPQEGEGPAEGGRDHTYTEVGLRADRPSPLPCLDDGLYESVGLRDADGGDLKVPPPASADAPVATLRPPPGPAPRAGGNGLGRGKGPVSGTAIVRERGVAPPSGANGSPQPSLPLLAAQEAVTAEYASIRKVRKVDKSIRKDNNGAAESDSQSSLGESPPAPPPPLPRSQEFPRKQVEPFHRQAPFPKEAVFMGNGEQYIWKPPEDDDVITLHPSPAHLGENGQGHPTVTEVSSTYSTVCKPLKKKPSPESDGAKTLPRCSGGDGAGGGRGNGVPAGTSGGGRGRGRGVQARSHEEPCYEPAGDKSWPASAASGSDPAYATIDSRRKRQRAGTDGGGAGGVMSGSATLKPRKKPTQPAAAGAPRGPPIGPPGPPPAPPDRAPPTGEHLYENVSDVKQGASGSGTTTIFTFNDGMEMYVTGL